jgi:tRNA A37 threonylcarbamoyladenosine synthetase subunit TsaC/SUA5/YrdC
MSNHKPIILHIEQTKDYELTPFNFNPLWLQSKGAWTTIEQAWPTGITVIFLGTKTQISEA